MSDLDERQYLAELRVQAVELAAQGVPADFIKAELAIPRSVRTVQRWVNQVHGRRPTRQAIQQRDVLRSRVVEYMESQGLSRYYCSACLRRQIEECFIRELSRDLSLDVLVFVCRHCATVADV